MNYTYIVRCKDDSLYCGWTNNLEKRIASHNAGTGAKYTRSRHPVELVYFETFDTKEEAMSREYAIKRLTRKEKLALIAKKGETMKTCSMNFVDPLVSGYMSEECLYAFIEQYAEEHQLLQTKRALPFAKKKHQGQTRKGEIIPYIYHPLLVAYHAIAVGLGEDDMVATAILHDVCEDCGVAVEDLPVGDAAKEAVRLLTKTRDKSSENYYADIARNRIATMVKILDRINNVSDMAKEFSAKKLKRYIADTEQHVYPLFQVAKDSYPEYANQIFLLEYHMVSVVSSVKCFIEND